MTAIALPPDGSESVVGRSAGDRDIVLYRFGQGQLNVLMLGGVHGDESEGFLFAERLVTELQSGAAELPKDVSLFVCPRLNPDGCADLRRTNQHNVDLNRNLPTEDWTGEFKNVRYYPGKSAGSEPESGLTVDLIEALFSGGSGLVISLHSYEHAMINFNGDCENLAQAMSEHNKLPPKGDIGYPTPGSLGTYAGWERNIPTITLEILRDQEPQAVWEQHRAGIMSAMRFYLSVELPSRKVVA